jgi:transcriptional regulator with XRE-family HTH domain
MTNKVYAHRAVALINQRCAQKNCTLREVLEEANIPFSTYNGWQKGLYNPTAPSLECMALAGYDVLWILLGGEGDER